MTGDFQTGHFANFEQFNIDLFIFSNIGQVVFILLIWGKMSSCKKQSNPLTLTNNSRTTHRSGTRHFQGLLSTRNTLVGQIWSKRIKNVGLRWNLVPRLFQICRIQWWCYFLHFWLEITFSIVMLTFLILDWKHPFWVNLVHKIKIVCLSWNLVPRLIQICRTQWWCSLCLF